ncbi:MAG: hypothetical protein NWF05_08620 [Candidatus Bathyarchaeota archaeon]|nr:hypothetical protein [Candidatus Bathyarchaeota archaeon]
MKAATATATRNADSKISTTKLVSVKNCGVGEAVGDEDTEGEARGADVADEVVNVAVGVKSGFNVNQSPVGSVFSAETSGKLNSELCRNTKNTSAKRVVAAIGGFLFICLKQRCVNCR